ncbi:MAG: phytoene desaturase family protein [Thermoleophilaceae bacterium]|jgi:phytoene desaturase
MRIAVIGAGVGGLAAAIRLAALGHRVTVLEQAGMPGGKCGRVELGGHRFDSGPSLLTMPWVFEELFAATGAPLGDEIELERVEPGTDYRFADGSRVRLGADLPPTMAALEAFSPGAGEDWGRFLGVCAEMWQASVPVLTGPPPWPPRRPRLGAPAPDPRDLLRVRPWRTLRGLARSTCRDPRLAMVIERFATYAGADPRRAPAALAVAGYVEHAFGAWYVRGGIYSLVEALVRRLETLGGELRLATPVRGIARSGDRVSEVETDGGSLPCDAVVSSADSLALHRDLLRDAPAAGAGSRERSLSGFALMLGLRGRTPGLAHHTILFPRDYDAEFDDVFRHRRPVRDPTLYVSAPADESQSPEGAESWFVLVNAPTHGAGLDWDAHADAYEETVLERLARRGLDVRERIEVRARRTPADLERETGAVGGAIYGDAPHGRLGTLGRPPNVSKALRGLYLVGGSTHPGGGLPLVALSGRIVAEEIGSAR